MNLTKEQYLEYAELETKEVPVYHFLKRHNKPFKNSTYLNSFSPKNEVARIYKDGDV